MTHTNSKTRTTVTLNSTELQLINEVLKPAEAVSQFVHLAISELIEKRRGERGLIKENKEV